VWSGILALAFVAFVARLYRRRTKRWDDDVEGATDRAGRGVDDFPDSRP
jgi:hypothetical protein